MQQRQKVAPHVLVPACFQELLQLGGGDAVQLIQNFGLQKTVKWWNRLSFLTGSKTLHASPQSSGFLPRWCRCRWCRTCLWSSWSVPRSSWWISGFPAVEHAKRKNQSVPFAENNEWKLEWLISFLPIQQTHTPHAVVIVNKDMVKIQQLLLDFAERVTADQLKHSAAMRLLCLCVPQCKRWSFQCGAPHAEWKASMLGRHTFRYLSEPVPVNSFTRKEEVQHVTRRIPIKDNMWLCTANVTS